MSTLNRIGQVGEIDDKSLELVTPPSGRVNPPLASRVRPYDTGAGPVTDAILNFLRIKGKHRDSEALDDIATQPSVYDGQHAEYYKPREDWENISAFDPSFRWTWREEQKAIRKVDWKIFTWILLMFLALDIDRANITNATADNLLKDLKLTQADYNLGNTLQNLGFLLSELPSQLISKRLGPDRWIPIQIIIFSVISGCQFWLKGRASFLACRFLIAAFQGGFIPDVILYLSYWYNKNDLPVRLAFFWSINYIADLLTAFLAVGLLKMRGIGGYSGWQWMFLLEGIATLVIGVASFWFMPQAPTRTKSKLAPDGYITDREAKIIVNRVIRDDPGKGGMHNRQALSFGMIFSSIMDWHMWPLYLIGLTYNLPSFPVKNYLQLSFKDLGFSTVNANLLTIPTTVISVFNIIIISVISELLNNRSFVAMTEQIWFLPCIIALECLATISGWQYFAIATILLGFPYVHAIHVSWCSRNSGTIRTRTVSASLYNMFVQVSKIIGANIYQASDKPRYHKGNRALLGIICYNLIILYPGTWLFYRFINKRRDAVWNKMTTEERAEYLATTKDEGNKRLDFRFAK
ncbi:uncharacterized protein I206_106775 [Kwoniella pini CBS 10737]|uniref:Major facilitator superfamily (MFS) profile domain-containing protein n=1 Tax=Kwoniella pini CBS 10737 TaxID=1296096 RepID=A0A1B9HT93_9TREE|nr:uncharacterized protein I206_07337 [Kwoniella pini CBS 10737]OCF46484.1 hypothetical protein I206_07337 [Kwoniella pini CBS 10737]